MEGIDHSEEAKELATAHSSRILNDEPMDLDALSALDQVATNYIEYSKAMEAAAIAAPPLGPGPHLPGTHSSALLYVGRFLGLRPTKGLLVEATSAGEPEQRGEQRRKRPWTMDESPAKAAKKGSGGENGEKAAAVRVDSEANEDEDDVVFVKEVHVHKSRKERREWAADHLDTLPGRSSLNSKARRHIRRQLAAAGRDLETDYV